jgi:hypothetical protein
MRTDLLARIVAVAAGVWLMAAPAVLGYGGAAETNDRIVGPIAASFAFVACWEVVGALRWPTVPLGAWLVAAPAVLGYGDAGAWTSSIAAGLVIVGTGLVGRDATDKFDGGWRSVRPRSWHSPTAR